MVAFVTGSMLAVFDGFLERTALVVDFLIDGTTARFKLMAKKSPSWRQLYIARLRLYKLN